MPGAQNYATVDDIAVYVPNVVPEEVSASWTTLLSVASRAVDHWCGRYFYDAGASVKYFDGPPALNGRNQRRLYLPGHDVRSVTLLRVASFEGADPASVVATDWTTVSGGGLIPPSNFFLEPANQGFIDSTTNVRPFSWIYIPDNPVPGTSTYVSGFTPGKRTVEVTGSWGWPVVPAELKDLVCKVVLRMNQANAAGFTGQVGSPDVLPGQALLAKYLDINDLYILNDLKRWTAF